MPLTTIGTAEVKFVGNTSQLDRTIRGLSTRYGNSLGPIASISRSAVNTSIERAIPSVLGAANVRINRSKVELDALNNTFRITSQIAVKTGEQIRRVFKETADGFDIVNGKRGRWERETIPIYGLTATLKTSIADVEKYTQAQEKINEILQARSGIHKRLRAEEAAARTVQGNLEAAIPLTERAVRSTRGQYGAAARAANANLRALQDALARYDALTTAYPTWRDRNRIGPDTGGLRAYQAIRNVQAEIVTLTDRAVASETRREAAMLRSRAASSGLVMLQQQLATATAETAAAESRRMSWVSGNRAQLMPLIEARKAAMLAASPPSANLTALQGLSPSLFKTLEKGGFSAARAFNISDITKDLTRGVNDVSGWFTNAQNRIVRFNAEVTDSGKVVTRFGGQLRGLGQILSQTTRDFQKVVEWTVATTIVFGSLQMIRTAIQSFKDLDATITRFSITANVSRREALVFFNDLAKIAEITATPINDFIKAADDIALATKRIGQSTEQWRAQIQGLSEAVGVFTNLTGQDTETATDTLVAIMKQLNLQGTELYIVLNKITAVAGGQASAIADISKGLGVMAEAAKTSNLSLDQTIATIQTLSQVTSKTPAEVATSFKNLVGALDNPASKKALAQYNIELKDQEGNLRNILDIYGEIAKLIRQGVIPESDVKELTRAISGGPRRAPDAAALLNSIDDIARVTATSINASNEALIANAKAVDTVQAKIVRLQSSIQSKLFLKFGDDFNRAFESIINILDSFIGTLSLVPEGLVALAAQFGIVFLAIKAFTGIGGRALVSLLGLKDGFAAATLSTRGFFAALVGGNTLKTFQAELAASRGQLILFSDAELRAQKASAWRTLGRGAAIAGAGAAVGGILSASSGGGLGSILGGVASGAGMGLMMTGHPVAMALGVGLMALSPIIESIIPKEQALEEVTKAFTEEQLAATQVIKESLSNYSSLKEQNFQLAIGIREAEDKLKSLDKTSAEYSTTLLGLNEQNRQYVLNLNEMTSTAAQAQEALNKLQGNKYLPSFIGQLSSANLGKAQTELTTQLLKEVYGEDFELIKTFEKGFQAIKLPSSTVSDLNAVNGLLKTTQDRAEALSDLAKTASGQMVMSLTQNAFGKLAISLEDIRKGGEDLRSIFDEATGQFKILPGSQEEFQAIVAGVEELKKSSPELAAAMEKDFNRIKASIDVVAAAIYNLDSAMAYLESGALISPFNFDPKSIQQANRVLQELKNTLEQIVALPVTGIRASRPDVWFLPDPKSVQQYAREIDAITQALMINTAQNLGTPDEQALKDASDASAKLRAEFWELNYGVELTDEQMKYLIDEFRLISDLPPAFDTHRTSAAQLNEQLEEMEGKFKGITDSFYADLAQKSAELEMRRRGGEFKDDPEVYAAESAQIQALLGQYDALIAARDRLVATYGEVNSSSVELAKKWAIEEANITSILGLQDAQNLSMDAFVDRMLSMIDVYNLNGQAAEAWVMKIIKIMDTVRTVAATLDKYPLTVKIQALVESHGAKIAAAMLRGMAAAIAAVDPAAAARYLAQADALDLLGSVDTGGVPATTPGASMPTIKTGGAKKPQGPDVSTLDIPEEILKAGNRDALLQEAIRRARALQSTIPGATKEARNDIVELLEGTKNILEVTGIKSEYLRKALEELADIEKQRLENELKADRLSRIRVGAGSFAAWANVPMGPSGISVGSPNGPISINVNINGQVMTPAQLEQLGNSIGATIGIAIANG